LKYLLNKNTYQVSGFESISYSEMLEKLSSMEVICVDTETRPKSEFMSIPMAGLDPHLSEIVMCQIGDEHDQFIIDVRHEDIMGLKSILEEPKVVKILQNAKFDYKMLLTNFGIRVNNIRDTMIQERVLTTGDISARASLEALAKKYVGFEFAKTNQLNLFEKPPEVVLTKSVRTEFKNVGSRPFTKRQCEYGVMDIILPIQIDREQQLDIKSQDLTRIAKLENDFIHVMGEIETNGFYLNVPKWKELYEQRLEEYQLARKDLVDYIFDNKMEGLYKWKSSLFESDKLLNINLSSSHQVVELLNVLGIDTKILDKKKSKKQGHDVFKDSIEERVLKKYKKRFKIVPLYLHFKQLEKAVTTYGIDFLNHVSPRTGRVHSSYRQIIRSGRMASSRPNLQNLPNGSKLPGYRECFTNSKPGTKLIVADYSGQETAILADRAQETAMIDFLVNQGGDFHSHTAKRMFGVNVSKTENPHLRQIAKSISFGLAYGMSAHKLATDFEITIEEAEDFIDKYYEAYPELNKYFKDQRRKALENGFILIDPVVGRKSFLVGIHDKYLDAKAVIDEYREAEALKKVPKQVWSDFYSAKGRIERLSQNLPIQGTAANMTKVAAIRFQKWIKGSKLEEFVKIVNMVHDEIVVECHDDYVSMCKDELEKQMILAGGIFCKTVPMRVDAQVGPFWDH
jgi:DNA polymerase-1